MALKPDKGLVFCADDYGLAPGLGTAIRTLVEMKRLSAVGCMTTSPYWEDEGTKLRELNTEIEIGLHLTLTDQPSLGNHPALTSNSRFISLGDLLKKALAGKLPDNALQEEINLQIKSFKTVMGRYPDFLDGHQHVHQFPHIRDKIVDIMRNHPTLQNTWIRVCCESQWRGILRQISFGRAFAIGLFGYPLRRLSRTYGIRTNPGFAGIYKFGAIPFDDNLMRRMIEPAINGTVIMCHPGLVDDALKKADSLTTPREQEYRYLMSDHFENLLKETGVIIQSPKELF